MTDDRECVCVWLGGGVKWGVVKGSTGGFKMMKKI